MVRTERGGHGFLWNVGCSIRRDLFDRSFVERISMDGGKRAHWWNLRLAGRGTVRELILFAGAVCHRVGNSAHAVDRFVFIEEALQDGSA